MLHWQRQVLMKWLKKMYGFSDADAEILTGNHEYATLVLDLVTAARESGKTIRKTQEDLRRLTLLLREVR